MAKPCIFIDLSEYNLKKQFGKIAKSLSSGMEFDNFIEAFLPKESSATYFLYPLAVKPELNEDKYGLLLPNIVFIPQHTIYQNSIVSDGRRLVMKGDININREVWFEFKVKDLWLSDSMLIPEEDQCEAITGYCVKAFNRGGFWKGSEYSGYDWTDTALNMETIEKIVINDRRPYAAKAYEEINNWKEYLEFRSYYMKNSVKDIPFNDCRLIKAYAMERKHYRDEEHIEYLLDRHEEFKNVHKDEAVILTKKIRDAEPCCILKLTKNNCNEEEVRMLRRLLRNQLKLDWTDRSKDNQTKNTYNLGSGDDILIKNIQDNTMHQTEIYLMLSEDLEKIFNNRLHDKCCDFTLGYDSSLEEARVKRQKQALFDLEMGNTKFPLISQYIFGPSSLPPCNNFVKPEDINWQTKKDLNFSQKIAVTKALSSTGIFLLQGPPGTGKTTVIAELTAQLVMRGKKVLIASETHKAIDNAFEDITALNLPEIRLLRILSEKKKEGNEWAVEKQTENFYASILRHLQGPAEAYRLFTEKKEKFNHTYSELLRMSSEIVRLRGECASLKHDIEDLEKTLGRLDQERNGLLRKADNLTEEMEEIYDSIYAIEQVFSNSPQASIENEIVMELLLKLRKMQSRDFPLFGDTSPSSLISADVEKVEAEIREINAPNPLQKLELKIQGLQEAIRKCRDEYDEVIPEKEEEYENLKSSLRHKVNQKNEYASEYNRYQGVRLVYTLVTHQILQDTEIRTSIPARLKEYQCKSRKLMDEALYPLKEKWDKCNRQLAELREKEMALHEKIIVCRQDLEGKRRNKTFKSLQESEEIMKRRLMEFFTEFEMNPDYQKDDYATALVQIMKEWEKITVRFEENQKIYERQKEIHKEIKAYVENGAVERDKPEIQRKLIERANVIGMTSTGASYDKKNGIEVPDMDIDVVIIDEVSKCSFLDLLRPMLYGQSVVLVGDHMQLPPMYDLKHLRQDSKHNDFEDLDEDIINPDINKFYTEMVESSIFQYLFENVPDSHRTMLTHQYRFHSQIMKINPFYGSLLKLGSQSLDDNKEHNIEINIRGRQILGREHHVCFVDCGCSYEMKAENSTSLINEGEANVVVELLKHLNLNIGEANSLSVGVICTYGRQARAIKRKIYDKKNKKYFSSLLQNKREKLTVSTVDDFQGDERDIIILSMVRNPRNWKTQRRFNLDFIQKYQRINVAVTRPRRLLIIVGARDFLENKAIIKLPNASSFPSNVPIFKQMLQEIENTGKITYLDHIIETDNNIRHRR